MTTGSQIPALMPVNVSVLYHKLADIASKKLLFFQIFTNLESLVQTLVESNPDVNFRHKKMTKYFVCFLPAADFSFPR